MTLNPKNRKDPYVKLLEEEKEAINNDIIELNDPDPSLSNNGHTNGRNDFVNVELEEFSEFNRSEISLPEKKDDSRKISGLKLKRNDRRAELMAIASKMSSKAKRVTFKRLMQQSKPERKLLACGILFTLLGSMNFLVTPILMGAIINSISQGERKVDQSTLDPPVKAICSLSPFGCKTAYRLLCTAVTALFTIALIAAFCSSMKWYLLERAGESIVARLRKQLFASILDQEIGWFDTQTTGELTNRLSTDTTILKQACTVSVCQALQSTFSAVISGIYVLYLSWSLTLVMFSIIPVVVIVGKLYGQYYRRQSKINQDILAHAIAIATESISLVRTVKSFSKEDIQENLFFEAIDATYAQGLKMALATAVWMGFFVILSNMGIGGVMWYGATQVIHGKMSSGSLATYVILIITIGANFGAFINLYSVFMRALGASERLFQLIDRKSKISNQPTINQTTTITTPPPLIPKINGYVELKNVTFSYPSRSNIKVVENISLQIKPGTMTALVGPSGGGKSTIAKLVIRLYDPDEGNIMVDNKNIKSYNLRNLHLLMGYVSQEPVLFARTIYDNVTYGIRRDVNMDDIIHACKTANCHNFITQFPEKYQTLVGERGIRLSGGQKQRIAIARAVLMDPTILVLDEATSALDSESEYLVKQALDILMKNRTVLVIAHRLSTVRQADNVVVIDEGKVVEQGTHDELISRDDGSYKKLVKRQLFS